MSAVARQDLGYSIGTVAGLTGLDPHTIRAWERRYGAVCPDRGPRGVRRYRDRDVTRLQLLKAVTDSGEAIGAVAALDDDALRERLSRLAEMAGSPATAPSGAPVRVALLAPRMAEQIGADASALGELRVATVARDRDHQQESFERSPCDVLVIEMRALGSEPSRALDALRAAASPRLVVLIYDFARASELARLSRDGARLLRGPVRAAQLRQAIEDFLVIEASAAVGRSRQLPEGDGEVPDRRFDDGQLARLLELRSSVQCECPSHVASLVSSVIGFERYSRDCENRSPEDALLHRYLAATSSRVRRELEQMLERVCEHEGIRI